VANQRNPAFCFHREQTRSLFSARKRGIDASLVTGLAVYSFSSSSDRFDIISSAAHTQLSDAMSSVAQPIGVADVVERPKPLVISADYEKNVEYSADGDPPTSVRHHLRAGGRRTQRGAIAPRRGDGLMQSEFRRFEN
jgi:hypothetical protein